MKLSDFENEEALDLLADIMEPAAKIMADKKVEAMFRAETPALIIAPYVLRHHKKSAIEIISALHQTTPDKLKFNAVSLLKDLIDLMNDEQVAELFTLQGQMTQDTSSGSAMGTTEDEKQ